MIRLKVKPGVRLLGISPQVTVAIMAAMAVWERAGAPALVVTSVTDGAHSPTSLHYVGHAVDLRVSNVPAGRRGMLQQDLAEALGEEYDVVAEKDHIHVEWQPER